MKALRRRPIRGDSLCLHRNTALAAVVFANGSGHVVEYCYDCERRSDFYGKDELRTAGVDADALEVVQDNRDPAMPCEVCGSVDGTELHHWAPQTHEHRFREYSAWPTVELCRECHREWHDIVTPDIAMHHVTLHDLGATRGMTLRQLLDRARDHKRGTKEAA